jgi:hypothetical protein
VACRNDAGLSQAQSARLDLATFLERCGIELDLRSRGLDLSKQDEGAKD